MLRTTRSRLAGVLKPGVLGVWLAAVAFAAHAADFDGGFEVGLAGWKPLWTRVAGAGRCELDRVQVHGGRQAVRIEHAGERDWSFEPDQRLAVAEGDYFELEAWVHLEGQGTVTLCAATLDANGRTLSWSFGERTVAAQAQWRRVIARFVVPGGVTQIQPRLIGSGPATIYIDDVAIRRQGNLSALRRPDLPSRLLLTNQTLTVAFNTRDGTFSVTDQRTSQDWAQRTSSPEITVLEANQGLNRIQCKLLHLASGVEFEAVARLEREDPELVVELQGEGELPSTIKYPHAFASRAGQYLVVPMNEGISYPVDDASIEPMRLIAYGGHGICMAFWGVTDGAAGCMGILETPDDASVRLDRREGKLVIGPEWESQRDQFGYARRLRYVFLDRGGHVAMCKRYRAYAEQLGLVKTLAAKRARNPNVDRLIGAVNVWCWDKQPLPFVEEMQALGIERILWSNRQSPEGLAAMNARGVLTSRYDIYQDVMNPAEFPQLRWIHPDWTTEGWPRDIMVNRAGDWIRGWGVEGKDNKLHPCGVLCDRVAPDYARRRIPAELKTHPYLCRFIDTTTASPWRECYAPEHPLTRTESKQWKMELLRCVSDEMKLVTGCETGHDASVPFVHYFEGMLSLGPYRVPDAGRDMQRIWKEVPAAVEKFQVGHRYRLPLWELVFHDCVVSQWYWGDYNNKLPALWDKRDLLNTLYGTPPMFMFDRQIWNANKARFAQSYRMVAPVARATAYHAMVDHQFLTADRDVQETTFANRVRVVVNFGLQPFRLSDGSEIGPMSSWTSGLER